MSTCADLREDLALHAHGLLEGAERDAVTAHVAACADCARELAHLVATLDVVRGLEITPTAAEIDALLDAVDDELDAGRASIHALPAWRRTWEHAVSRYEHSSRFRRITLASIGLHAAAAAGIAWLLVGGGDPTRRPDISYQMADDVADLLREDKRNAIDEIDGGGHRVVPDEYVAGDPLPYEQATPEGVRLPSVMEPGSLRARGEAVRAPTVGILVRLRAALDEDYRGETLSARLGDELAPRAVDAVEQGLLWLAERRAEDGRWGPIPSADGEDVRDGVTAAVVLAFVQNGHSAREGAHAATLAPAIHALESRLRDGPAERDVKPVYSHALSLRALAWEWALDFRHLSEAEREARRRLLAASARELLDTQHASGGFGYRADERPDASCTLFVAGALADLRLAGVVRADAELRRAGAYLQSVRGTAALQGYREPGDRAGDPALTAGVLAYARELGIRGDLSEQLRTVREALVAPHTPDALLAWSGLQVLRRRDGVSPALERLLGRQRADGRWRAETDRHCRVGGDDLTTAMGVLAVSRVYMP